MNTSLSGTINNYSCLSYQGNIIIDEKIPIACSLTTLPQKIQSNKHNDNYVDDYIASLTNQIRSLKNETVFLRQELTKKNSLINSFLLNNHVHPFSISHTTDANKIHHQKNWKHGFIQRI